MQEVPIVCLRPAAASRSLAPSLQPLVQKATLAQERTTLTQKERGALRKEKLDPYRWQQAQQRKNRNLERQKVLKADRDQAWGDPVNGLVTPFLESFDRAGQSPQSQVRRYDDGNPLEEPHALPTSEHILNYQLTKQELDEAIAESYKLTAPSEGNISSVYYSDVVDQYAQESHEEHHRRAVEALKRITTLDNASSKDRRHANIRRIVETFGRHETDAKLRQKPLVDGQAERMEKIRGGPDTGSSEVQIAILTAKIRVLAAMYAGKKGNKDKHNKKNLRLLLHRRQKLLKYMERRERGSGRWEHMVETLGLSPATYKKQIEVR
ncbi:putative ribosomal protein s15 precursor-like protein [Diaporthe ampelina]|uniref:Putative ribosomal protein s15-like protein n=1 Tax=Diaporthe ampelina TaxID=1214573 RepID=A0A0G2FRC7_9PEZI|nr:putative ribosomal protein s15 precursor-like protein [Diaporthe ampelina]